jgi:AAA+ superfamily predicted ATPase
VTGAHPGGRYWPAMSAHPSDALLASLLAAVEAAPDDVPLRLHLAELLLGRGRGAEALAHCSRALALAPSDPAAIALLQRVTAALAGPPASADEPTARLAPKGAPRRGRQPEPEPFDWRRAEEQLSELPDVDTGPVPVPAELPGDPVVDEAGAAPAVRLADVGGMEHVKQRLELSFLGPMRNPELARAFGKGLAGGLLLYGPPGCGKTFLARAVAGELGAGFTEVGIADVLDMWVGRSERNLAEVFRAARRKAPHVLFLDEIDALGRKRSHLAHASSLRNTVNQLLTEMDSLAGRNDGVFVLGATNHPWDLDSALRRPGRFDRTLLVLPPDPAARAAILRHNLAQRPVTRIDYDRLVRITEHYSGADLAHLCDTAAERALAESVRTGTVRPLTTADLLTAAREVRPSTGPWFATARNVALFGNADGSYDELAAYLKKNRTL